MALNYNLKGTDITLTDEIRDYLDQRLQPLEKLLPQESYNAAVELQFSSGDAGQKYRAEYTITGGGHTFRAEKNGTTLHEAIDLASGELARELRQAKGKRLKVFRRTAAKIKNFLKWGREE